MYEGNKEGEGVSVTGCRLEEWEGGVVFFQTGKLDTVSLNSCAPTVFLSLYTGKSCVFVHDTQLDI